MRRKDREIVKRDEIDAIIKNSQVCRLCLSDDGQPYVVPLCFGYDGTSIYFHCASEGRKLDIINRNCRVSVEFDIVDGLVVADRACAWGIRYRSVIGFGTAEFVLDDDEKREALRSIMEQYGGRVFGFPDHELKNTAIIKIDLEEVTGKKSH